MKAWFQRLRAIVTTPLDARALRRLGRELLFSEQAGALWRSPLSDLWERIKVVPVAEDPGLEALPRLPLHVEAVKRLKADVFDAEAFNAWREEHSRRPLMLAKIDLRGRDLRHVDLRRCILFGADLRGADLRGCRLGGAILKQARIAGAQLEDDTLNGHDLEELADALEDLEFQKYLRQMDPQRLSNLVSISEQGKTFKNRKKIMVWKLKIHNNFRQTIKLKIWLDNSVRSEMVSELTLGAHESQILKIEIERKLFPPQHAVTLNTFVEGVNKPIRQVRVWAWDRASL